MLLKQKITLILLSTITITINQAIAEPGIKIIKNVQAIPQQHENHSKQRRDLNESQKYHGVFYGFLPCKNCEGTKTTLSLKNRNNYLLVSQDAKSSAREYFEKGKYTWDSETKIVTLIARKGSTIRKYRINDDKTLSQLSAKGSPLKSKQKNTSYDLHKNDKVRKNTSMHMH